MKYKTFVLERGTKFQEFFGHDEDYGWITSARPIHFMDEDVTWDDVNRACSHLDPNFKGVDLVTIEIKILEDE